MFMRAFAHLFEGKPSGLNTLNILRSNSYMIGLQHSINQTVIDDFTAAREAVRVSGCCTCPSLPAFFHYLPDFTAPSRNTSQTAPVLPPSAMACCDMLNVGTHTHWHVVCCRSWTLATARSGTLGATGTLTLTLRSRGVWVRSGGTWCCSATGRAPWTA